MTAKTEREVEQKIANALEGKPIITDANDKRLSEATAITLAFRALVDVKLTPKKGESPEFFRGVQAGVAYAQRVAETTLGSVLVGIRNPRAVPR